MSATVRRFPLIGVAVVAGVVAWAPFDSLLAVALRILWRLARMITSGLPWDGGPAVLATLTTVLTVLTAAAYVAWRRRGAVLAAGGSHVG